MPYEVTWLVPDRVILARHYGKFTREDLHAYLAESFALRDSADQTPGAPLVHTVTDASAMTSQDMNIGDLRTVLEQLREQRVGWSVYISPNPVTRFLASIGHQFAGVRYRAFGTMAEAIAFLQDADKTLPVITPPDQTAVMEAKRDATLPKKPPTMPGSPTL